MQKLGYETGRFIKEHKDILAEKRKVYSARNKRKGRYRNALLPAADAEAHGKKTNRADYPVQKVERPCDGRIVENSAHGAEHIVNYAREKPDNGAVQYELNMPQYGSIHGYLKNLENSPPV